MSWNGEIETFVFDDKDDDFVPCLPVTGTILDLKLYSEEANFVPGTDSTLDLKL